MVYNIIPFVCDLQLSFPIFTQAMLDKFQILDLTEYSRVIFLDSDVIPLCNMDYTFEFSEGGGWGMTI